MRSFLLNLAALLAFTGAAAAQTESQTETKPLQILHDTSAEPAACKSKSKRAAPAKPTVRKASASRSGQRSAVKSSKHRRPPQRRPHVRAARYGGFQLVPPSPPVLDTTSPRTLSLVNANSGEVLSVTYWSNGTYHRDALDQLNRFLRDWRENRQTEMDPLLFDVLWHTAKIVGYGGTIEVLSAYRSPTTNAWLASVRRGVASDSQHINGNAMDVRFPGVPVTRIRQAARSLNMGGVGFYPRSGFVHLDTGPVRYW